MTSHERIGSALNSGNLKNDLYHFDADLIAALAFVSRLGSQLQHLASAGQAQELQPAVAELGRVLKKACQRKKLGISNQDAQAAALQAMREWVIKICRTCNGSGQRLLSYEGKLRAPGACNHCEGTGLFKPTWRWRREMMRLDAEASQDWWDKRIELGKEIAEDAYRSARRKVHAQMQEMSEE